MLGIITLRLVLTLILVLMVLNTSCTRSVPLQSGGKLSAVERQNIVAIHPGFTNWNPSQSALWVRHGVTRHVCIREGGVGSLTMPYEVFVFDDTGGVVEANFVQAPNPSTPKNVYNVSPLQMAYECDDGRTVVVGLEYPQEVARHEFQKQMDLQQKCEGIVSSWKRSGSTNSAELYQMLDNAITNYRAGD